MNSGLARRALAHLDAWTWLVADYRTWLIVIATVIGMAAPLLSAARKHRPKPAPSVVIRSASMALGFSGHRDCLLTAAFQRPALAGAWPAGDHAPERARRPVQLRQADRGRGQLSRRRPGRVPGYPGVSPRRPHLRAPGSGCPLGDRPDLAACPPRRHQADRARRNTKISRHVRSGTVTGCRDIRNKQPETARLTQL
jgi:hypothetical protein